MKTNLLNLILTGIIYSSEVVEYIISKKIPVDMLISVPVLLDIAKIGIEYYLKYKTSIDYNLQAELDHLTVDEKDYETVNSFFEDYSQIIPVFNSQYVCDQIKILYTQQQIRLKHLSNLENFTENGDYKKFEQLVKDLNNLLVSTTEHNEIIDISNPNLIDSVFNQDIDQENNFLTFGISALDEVGCLPQRKQTGYFLGRSGTGKSFFLINLAIKNALKGASVFHISLEMQSAEVYQRYIQVIHKVKLSKVENPTFNVLKNAGRKKFTLQKEEVKQDYDLSNPNEEDFTETIKSLKESHLNYADLKIKLKKEPLGTYTFKKLQDDLRALKSKENFVPDIVIIDYLDLMYKNTGKDLKDYEVLLNMYREFATLAETHNFLGFTAHQVTDHEGAEILTTSKHARAAKAILEQVYYSFSINATFDEKDFGITRLYLEKVRNTSGVDTQGKICFITSNLHLGNIVASNVLGRKSDVLDIGEGN